MATPRVGGMKGFYKQQKKGGSSGISKSKKKKSPPSHSSDVTQPPALVTPNGSLDLLDDYDANEEMLRQFDMNIAYGPCIGIPRLDRWNRATKLGLNPPQEIETLLKSGKVQSESLWDGRV